MKIKEIDNSLSVKILNYLEYYLRQDVCREEEMENFIINKITPKLKE